MLDQATFPRNKTCGDGLTPRGVSVIDRLGVLEEVKSVGQRIDYAKVIAPNGRSMTTNISQSTYDDAYMLAVPRFDLDNVLVKNAVATGAVLQEGCKVTEITDKPNHVIVHGMILGEVCQFNAKYAIVATGASMEAIAL